MTLQDEEDLEDKTRYNNEEEGPFRIGAAQLHGKPPTRKVSAYCPSKKSEQGMPSHPPPPLTVTQQKAHTGVQAALRQAEMQGDTDFAMGFPVVYSGDFGNEDISWEPIPYKLLKELKIACKDYGPLAPYTLTLLEALSNCWMTPYDWTQVAKACLTGGNYLL